MNNIYTRIIFEAYMDLPYNCYQMISSIIVAFEVLTKSVIRISKKRGERILKVQLELPTFKVIEFLSFEKRY